MECWCRISEMVPPISASEGAMTAPFNCSCTMSDFLNNDAVRSAPLKFVPSMVAPNSTAPCSTQSPRLAPLKSDPAKFTLTRFACRKFAHLKSVRGPKAPPRRLLFKLARAKTASSTRLTPSPTGSYPPPSICTNNRPSRMSASSKLAASKLARCRVMPRKSAFERSAPRRSAPSNTAANREIPTMEAS